MTLIQIDNYGPWTVTPRPRTESDLQMLQASLFADLNNHFGNKKITHDPTPLQVEMRKYECDIDTAFIENASRKEHNIDVD